jgi:hypothetical protein
MAIPKWITATVNEVDKSTSVDFMDDTYKKLLDMYKGGKLDDWASQVIEELECLRDVMNTAVSQVNQKLEGGVDKTAAPASKAEAPFEFGDERLKEEMTPKKEDTALPASPSRKLPPKIKEPETTKWKEIRFNKRTGTWQTVITIRHTRNFMTEAEAIDFTKKAGLNEKV